MPLSPSIQKIINEYLELPSNKKASYLALLCYYISMFARETYSGIDQGSSHSAVALMIYNELGHRVSRQLISVLQEDDTAYPHGTFLQSLVEYAESKSPSIEHDLIASLLKAWKGLSKTSDES